MIQEGEAHYASGNELKSVHIAHTPTASVEKSICASCGLQRDNCILLGRACGIYHQDTGKLQSRC